MKEILKKYPYGFLLSDFKADNIPDHYEHVTIVDKFNYYFDSKLSQNIYTKDDKFIIIHGHFVYVNKNGEASKSKILPYLIELYITNYDNFLDALNYIGGRYVVIIGDLEKVEVYPDASASRSAYYSLERNVLSSHVHLINEVIPHEIDKQNVRAQFLNYTWNYTPYSNIKSIICNSYLDLFSKDNIRFFPRKTNEFKFYTEEERFQLFERLWEGQFESYYNNYKNIIFSLTGGEDSKFTLALSYKYLKGKNSFTYTNKVDVLNRRGTMFRNDKEKVKEILKYVKLNHHYIYVDQPENLSVENREILDKNTVKEHGRHLIPLYNNIFKQKDKLHVRSGLLELGEARLIDGDNQNNYESIKKVHSKLHIGNKTELIKSGINIEEILDDGFKLYNYDKDLYDYHMLDLFYIEHRMGRWHTEILNETDSSFDTFLPFNMRALMDISLSFELSKRKQRYFYNELVNRNFPILNFFGSNNKSNLYEETRKYIYNDTSKNTISNNFKIFNKSTSKVINTSNLLYIPKNYFIKGNFAKTTLIFQKEKGYMNICLNSKYFKESGKGYIEYSILRNGQVVYIEDMALWPDKNNVNIFNLKQGDKITLKVRALRDTSANSWSAASKLHLESFKQVEFNTTTATNITVTSPMGTIYE